MGLPWTPGDVSGRPPLFDLDQLTKIHATVLQGAIEQGDFVTRSMGIWDADIRCRVREVLQRLRMPAVAGELLKQAQEDNTRTNRWLRN
jgi:hypothetical protein